MWFSGTNTRLCLIVSLTQCRLRVAQAAKEMKRDIRRQRPIRLFVLLYWLLKRLNSVKGCDADEGKTAHQRFSLRTMRYFTRTRNINSNRVRHKFRSAARPHGPLLVQRTKFAQRTMALLQEFIITCMLSHAWGNAYGVDVCHDSVIERVHLVDARNAEQRQTTADRCTKPTDLNQCPGVYD